MIPKSKYLELPEEEQKLWHSHEFEVQSGMLVLPTPETHRGQADKWEKLETQALSEVVGLYGKIFHFWQIDRGDELPFGMPRLMGSLTEFKQLNVDEALKDRDERFGVSVQHKREVRQGIEGPGIPENADSWWKEAKKQKLYTLAGHRSVGGCRASLYNGMPMEGVEKLYDFMKSFMDENRK